VKKLFLVAAVIGVAWYLAREPAGVGPAPGLPPVADAPYASTPTDAALARAWEDGSSGVRVSGRGRVTRILGDDSLGDRHQRFVLALDSGQTILIAHNIDLAPRVEPLREGDLVEFNGEYEWNDKGGIVHWTHHDPQGRQAGGWLRHDGRTYD
jgi:hypothetical protein